MWFFQRLFGDSRERITADELGRQLAGIALRSGFVEENAIAAVVEKAAVASANLDVRREILAFAVAPLAAIVFASLDEPTAERVRESLMRHLLNALGQSVQPEYQARINWESTASALSLRVSEYRYMLEDESGPSDYREALLRLAGTAYKNIVQRDALDAEAMTMLAGRYQMTVKHMGPVVRKYRVE